MRYPGGKGKTFQHIINVMPPHRTYVESHLGGGAVLRNKRPSERTIAIDADPRVIEYWSRQSLGHPCELISGDASEVLPRLGLGRVDLVYADPPYLPSTRRRRRVYRHDMLESDHEALLQVLQQLDCHVIVSGYACELYDTVLKTWNRFTFEAMSHSGPRTEVLWLNFDPPPERWQIDFLGASYREREVIRRRLARIQHRVSQLSMTEQAALSKWLRSRVVGAASSVSPGKAR